MIKAVWNILQRWNKQTKANRRSPFSILTHVLLWRPPMNCIVRECGELVEMNHVLLLIMSKRRLCLKLNNWMKNEMKSLHQNVAPIVLDKVQSFVYPWWPSVSSPDPVGTPCLFAPQWECYEISPIQQNDQPNVRPKCSFVWTSWDSMFVYWTWTRCKRYIL